MDLNGCVGLSYATTACSRANIEQSGLLHSARDHATIDCVSLVRRVSTEQCIKCKKPAPFLLQSTHTHPKVAPAAGRGLDCGSGAVRYEKCLICNHLLVWYIPSMIFLF